MSGRVGLLCLSLVALLSLPGCIALDFSPDGRRIAVNWEGGLTLINVDGSGAQVVPDSKGSASALWSPDGRYLVFVSLPEGTGESRLLLYDVEKSTARQVGTNYATGLAWREDGRRFAAVQPAGEQGDAAELVVYNVPEGGTTLRVRLPVKEVADQRMVWLPATDDVALVGGSDDKYDVYTVESGEVHRVSTTGDIIGLSLSGDRKRLVWARRSANPRYILLSLYGWDLAARSAVRLPFPDRVPLINPDPRHAPQKVLYVAFAPDGARVAILAEVAPAAKAGGASAENDYACYSVGMDGSGAQLVRRVPNTTYAMLWPVWSRDGKTLAVLDLAEHKAVLALYDAPGGNGRVVLRANPK